MPQHHVHHVCRTVTLFAFLLSLSLSVKLRRKQNTAIYLILCCKRLRTGREALRAVLAGVTTVQECEVASWLHELRSAILIL